MFYAILGIVVVVALFLMERDAEGFRVLRTAEDLDWFAQFFDYGGEYASGRLLSDIDYKDRDGFLNTSNWFYIRAPST